jgi:hypothetical protein
MNQDELLAIMNENMKLFGKLTPLIQRLQDVGVPYAFFAIEAQNNLMKVHAMLLGKRKGLSIWDKEKESDTSG